MSKGRSRKGALVLALTLALSLFSRPPFWAVWLIWTGISISLFYAFSGWAFRRDRTIPEKLARGALLLVFAGAVSGMWSSAFYSARSNSIPNAAPTPAVQSARKDEQPTSVAMTPDQTSSIFKRNRAAPNRLTKPLIEATRIGVFTNAAERKVDVVARVKNSGSEILSVRIESEILANGSAYPPGFAPVELQLAPGSASDIHRDVTLQPDAWEVFTQRIGKMSYRLQIHYRATGAPPTLYLVEGDVDPNFSDLTLTKQQWLAEALPNAKQ